MNNTDKLSIINRLSSKFDFLSQFTEDHLVNNLNWNVHQRDTMGKAGLEYYLQAGLDAVETLYNTVDQDPQLKGKGLRILDYPCGFGRILRWLPLIFDSSEIYASDVIPEAVEFCGSEFDCNTFEAFIETEKVELPQNLDLIWVGSLFTHIPKVQIAEILSMFSKSLNTGGKIVCTTHGFHVRWRMSQGLKNYNLTPSRIERIVEKYDNEGFGFQPYKKGVRYGISMINYDVFYNLLNRKVPDLKIVKFVPKGWVSHQDIFILEKV